MVKTIDINCDLGEGIGNEELVMPYITSCNIACGGHAGNQRTMSHVVNLAQKFKVNIGAHPSFPDQENFGRKVMELPSNQLFSVIRSQIVSLDQILLEKNLSLNHVKPHGALYNCAVIDENIAEVIIQVVKSFDKNLMLYVPYQSVIEKKAIYHGVPVKLEAFADRNYNSNLTLVARNHPNAIIHDPIEMFQHIYEMIMYDKVITIHGVGKSIKAETFCVHGDGKNIVNNLKILIAKLRQHNIVIR